MKQTNQGRAHVQFHRIILQKEKKKKNINKNLTFNLELNTNKIQAQRQLGAYLFWHCVSGIILIHSKHPTQCSAIIHMHLCIGRTGLCAVVLCALFNSTGIVLSFFRTHYKVGELCSREACIVAGP